MTQNPIAQVVDAIVADLTGSVNGLADAILHKYAPWDPEEMAARAQGADGRKRHLAIWPGPSTVEVSTTQYTTTEEIMQTYLITCWENATGTLGKGKTKEDDDLAFIELYEETRDRFYLDSNRNIGQTQQTRFTGGEFAPASGRIRWWAITVTSRVMADYQ